MGPSRQRGGPMSLAGLVRQVGGGSGVAGGACAGHPVRVYFAAPRDGWRDVIAPPSGGRRAVRGWLTGELGGGESVPRDVRRGACESKQGRYLSDPLVNGALNSSDAV
jgi:hypothetical protein